MTVKGACCGVLPTGPVPIRQGFMDWTDQIYRYCERGQSAAFWAEPLNALSNIAFLLAGVAAAIELIRGPGIRARPIAALLVLLVLTIGAGSFLFHTFATRWSSLADVAPIGLFMLTYFIFVLRMFIGLPWPMVAAGVAAFIYAFSAAGAVQCQPGVLSIAAYAHGPCLNGSVGYLPALVAMLGTAGVLAATGHPAWRYLAPGSLVFLASLAMRTFDLELCPQTMLLGQLRGTHALWHILNAVTLYLLLRAAIRHARWARVEVLPPPLPV